MRLHEGVYLGLIEVYLNSDESPLVLLRMSLSQSSEDPAHHSLRKAVAQTAVETPLAYPKGTAAPAHLALGTRQCFGFQLSRGSHDWIVLR